MTTSKGLVQPIRSLWIQAVIMLLGIGCALGQDATGRVVGTVTDAQGASVPGVKVTATNTATGQSRQTTTDESGSYQILQLPIGGYTVSAERSGFAKTTTSENQLSINQSLRLDITLQVGAVSETVAVEAQAAGVETINATLGQAVTSRPIINLPLNGRNVLDLAKLQPGVTLTNTDSTAAGTVSIAGSRTDSVTFLLDGGVNNNLLTNGVVYNPNPDTVAEFRILTSNYTAEYGRNGGGVISVVTKSGTNELHGSAFDYLRNDAFNANSFFNNQTGDPRPTLKRNQFGGTIGGPVVIPKLVDGRNKFFFFFGYQGQRQTNTVFREGVATFTPAELNGDFSRSGPNGGPDPDVAAFLQENPFFQSNPALAARGIIDPSRINSVAQKYIAAKLVPTSVTGTLLPQSPGKADVNEYTQRYDLNFTEKDRVAVTLGASRAPSLVPGTNVAGFSTNSQDNNYFGSVTYTKIFTPSLLNEARFSAQRANRLQASPATKAPTAADLGVGTTPDNPTGPPRLNFNSGLAVGFSPNGPTNLINNTYVYQDTLTWTRGRHTIKGGFTFTPYQNNTVYDYYVNGEFVFSGSPDAGGIGSGNDRADFLFGLPDEYYQFGEAPSNIRSKNYAGFVQDEWKVRKNLTLTLGLRYEYSSPKFDTQGRSFSLKYGAQSSRFVNAPTGLLFPGDPGAPKGANFPDRNDWAPRFGFAWDPRGNGRTSIRGGFGVFYDILKGEDNLQFNGQAPFFGFSDLYFDPLSANPTRETNYLSAPYVATGIPNSFPSRAPAKDISFADSGFLPFGGGGVFFVDPKLRTPYIYQFNVSLQQQLVSNMVAEISYVGSSSHKLTGLVDSNPFLRTQPVRLFNAQPGLDQSSDTFSYLDTFKGVVNASYNSLQASLTKRLSNTRGIGTTYFTLAYTFAHNIDNASGFRQRNSLVPYYNEKYFRASADGDLRHTVVFSGGWDLPFAQAWSGGPKLLTQGWSLYPIITYRSGFPLDVFAGVSRNRRNPGPSGAGDGSLVRANLSGSTVTTFDPKMPQSLGSGDGNYYFNPANFNVDGQVNGAYRLPGPGQATYGTMPRNSLRGPDRTNFDLAVAKTTPIFGERLRSEFRAEAFNLFNSVQFNNPNSIFTSDTFGRITTTADPRVLQLVLRFTF